MRQLSYCVCVIAVVVGGCDKSRGANEDTPISEQKWPEAGSLLQWGNSGASIYTLFSTPQRLDVWTCSDGILKMRNISLKNGDEGVFVAADRYIVRTKGTIVLMDGENDRAISQWKDDRGWLRRRIDPSSWGGRYVGVIYAEDFGNPPQGFDWEKARLRVCMLDVKAGELTSVLTLAGSGSEDQVRRAVPSDDGALMAIAGWSWGVTLVDTQAKRVLWHFKPEGEAFIGYAVFAPDRKTVFCGGTSGAVYSIDVKTGKVSGKWFATDSGVEEYGHRITCLAISPDGRFVAAGTGPEGFAYLAATQTNQKTRTLRHGTATILAATFSADSQYLVTANGKSMKVWQTTSAEERKVASQPKGGEGEKIR